MAQSALPQPKPITVAPLPKPGQFTVRPPAEAKPAEAAKPAPGAKPAEASRAPANPAGRPEDYGTTPVPWPKGSTDPAHFPAGFPRIPGLRRAAWSMSAQTASAYFLSREGVEAVTGLYLDFVAREQWTPVPLPGPPLEGERIVIARKGDWSLRVDLVPKGGLTEVFFSASLKPLAPRPAPGAERARP